MKVLNFAHLKKQSKDVVSASCIKEEPKPSAKGGVISFAHLKPKPKPNLEPTILQRVSCIGIAKTARLAAVNYCAPCPRFWPADDNERAQGVAYGRCMRKYDGWVEEWRIIPDGARVYQCSYHRGDDDREIHGPAPCSTKNWKLEMK